MNTDCTDRKRQKQEKLIAEIGKICGQNRPVTMGKYKYEEVTREIINAAHTVHNKLGCGFLEKVYHNSLVIELRKRGFLVEQENSITVKYDDHIVGEYFADIVVDNKVIIEVKATNKHNSLFEAQLLNYLKATNLEIGLIVNFGASVQVKRMVL